MVLPRYQKELLVGNHVLKITKVNKEYRCVVSEIRGNEIVIEASFESTNIIETVVSALNYTLNLYDKDVLVIWKT